MYRALLRPLLFALPPALAHRLALVALGPAEHLAVLRAAARALFAPPPDARLAVDVMGLRFPSPIGLAAGFDKNALRPRALAALGFGHLELGTVTRLPQAENPKPNLFRLPADHALVNRLGFPNEGAERAAARLGAVRSKMAIPVGISVGKSRAVPADDLAAVVEDYVEALARLGDVADFVVVNVSSPNTPGLRTLQAGAHARALLGALRKAQPAARLLVKISPDLADAELDDLLAAAGEAGMTGVVATNTTIGREGLTTPAARVTAIGAGGLSGAPLRQTALRVVAKARARLGAGAVVIGVGGVESVDDVRAMLAAGANLVQVYTAFVYEGPGLPGRLARGLLARAGGAPS